MKWRDPQRQRPGIETGPCHRQGRRLRLLRGAALGAGRGLAELGRAAGRRFPPLADTRGRGAERDGDRRCSWGADLGAREAVLRTRGAATAREERGAGRVTAAGALRCARGTTRLAGTRASAPLRRVDARAGAAGAARGAAPWTGTRSLLVRRPADARGLIRTGVTWRPAAGAAP